jgi:hypothetical protein
MSNVTDNRQFRERFDDGAFDSGAASVGKLNFHRLPARAD